MKNLVLVESPAKCSKLQKFLGKDFIVMASYGHVRDLDKGNGAIDKKNNFEPTYIISEDKKDLVKKLKEVAKTADCVYFASDLDREGESIAWHLSELLNVPKSKSKRITFNEITEKAILNAISSPRQIDMDLVNAQQARRVLDRLVGFDLSPLLWKIQKGLSAGRVQSVCLRLVVDREREYQAFNAEADFKVVGTFEVKDKSNKLQLFKATLGDRFKKKEDAQKFLEKCIGKDFYIKNIETKPAKKSASAPFTTSSLQQEASRKLGFSVDRTMQVAQKLYEAGKITYMRTDSVTLSDEALSGAKEQITKNYGDQYSNKKQFQGKSKNAQEAHECCRPTHFDEQNIVGSIDEQRLYELIWKRTMASQMADAIFDATTAVVACKDFKEEFIAKGWVLKFDGFLSVYNENSDETEKETEDEEESKSLPLMLKGQETTYSEIDAYQVFTKPAARYTEASLVKKLEELGIGRPSTYANTISTIMNRGYSEKKDLPAKKRDITTYKLRKNKVEETIKSENFGAEKSKIFPTDIGNVVIDYLVKNFPDVLDYKFTANVENDFDEIAEGKIEWQKMIKNFYEPFSQKVQSAKQSKDSANGERILGKDKNGKSVSARIGRFGPLVQVGLLADGDKKEDIKFGKIPEGKSIETITLKEALEILAWPKHLGEHKGKEVVSNTGKFGPYVRWNEKFYSITQDPAEVTLEEAIEAIKIKEAGGGGKGAIKEFDKGNIKVLDGKFGPYISVAGTGKTKKATNYKIPPEYTPSSLTKEECLNIIEGIKAAPKKKFVKKKK